MTELKNPPTHCVNLKTRHDITLPGRVPDHASPVWRQPLHWQRGDLGRLQPRDHWIFPDVIGDEKSSRLTQSSGLTQNSREFVTIRGHKSVLYETGKGPLLLYANRKSATSVIVWQKFSAWNYVTVKLFAGQLSSDCPIGNPTVCMCKWLKQKDKACSGG